MSELYYIYLVTELSSSKITRPIEENTILWDASTV